MSFTARLRILRRVTLSVIAVVFLGGSAALAQQPGMGPGGVMPGMGTATVPPGAGAGEFQPGMGTGGGYLPPPISSGGDRSDKKPAPESTIELTDGEEFDGSRFTCLQYTNGFTEDSTSRIQSLFGNIWMEGILAGYYTAQSKLVLSSDATEFKDFFRLLIVKCMEYPSNSVQAVVLQAIANEQHKLPTLALNGLSLDSYSCGQYLDAVGGDAAARTRADMAGLWAFAFIQGYKAFAKAGFVIPIESKPILTAAVEKNCANKRDMAFLNLAALVAQKVKLK